MTYDDDEVANSVSEQGAIPLIVKVLEIHKNNVGVAEQALAALCLLVSTHGEAEKTSWITILLVMSCACSRLPVVTTSGWCGCDGTCVNSW